MLKILSWRLSVRALTGTTALLLASVLGAAAIIPASADDNRHCNSPNPCFKAKNRGTGQAIDGLSLQGTGITGETNSNLNTVTMFAGSPITATSGVIGTDNSTNTTGDGNQGVLGLSLNGIGVGGATASTDPAGQIGVVGVDFNLTRTSANIGVFGDSAQDIGVFGNSFTGVGIFGHARDSGGVGVFGTSPSGIGVFARNADPSFEALRAVNRGGGAVIRAFSSPNTATAATEILELDTHGNLIITGTLTSNGTPMSVARTKQGARVAFGPQQSMATTEDFG